jgi:DNA-binding LytR/AlgR family response regulator
MRRNSELPNKVVFKNVLLEPFPIRETSWKLIVLISLFVSMFMVIFQPFGSSNLPNSSRIFILFGYGLVTMIGLSVNLKLITRFFKSAFTETNWTVLKEVLWVLWILFTIGALNFLYTDLLLNNIGSFIQFQLYTLSIGFFVVLTLTLISTKVLKSKYQVQALEFGGNESWKIENVKDTILNLTSENGKNQPPVRLNQLLYIESQKNYVLVQISEEDSVQTIKFRSTLSSIELQLAESGITQVVRCHRAFLINLEKVNSFTGNAQGLKLIVNHDKMIPVSRTYVTSIKAALQVNT